MQKLQEYDGPKGADQKDDGPTYYFPLLDSTKCPSYAVERKFDGQRYGSIEICLLSPDRELWCACDFRESYS